MSHEDERLARAALSRAFEPGEPRVLGVVSRFGAEELLARLRDGEDLQGFWAAGAARLATVDPRADLDHVARLGGRFVIPGDPEWPAQLDDLASVPPLNERTGVPLGLWVRGPLRLDTVADSVAIVGSRAATTYGDELAGDLAVGVARAGRPVVSGAAFGIDHAAHRGALVGGAPTVAVLACGVDRAYPRTNAPLLEHLYEHGAVVAETPLGGAPQRIRFLARNRVIAALTRGTVVVEAAIRSGALNTAHWAQRLNRVVMGVPGPVTSPASGGVHQLLRTGGAELVTSAEEVLELVGAAGEHLLDDPRGPVRARDAVPLRHQQVLDAVPLATGAPAASIARVAGLPAAEVSTALAHLETAGLVELDDEGWRLAASAHR